LLQVVGCVEGVLATQIQTSLSYKQGLLGPEDLFAAESRAVSLSSDKPMEICTMFQKGSWGRVKNAKTWLWKR